MTICAILYTHYESAQGIPWDGFKIKMPSRKETNIFGHNIEVLNTDNNLKENNQSSIISPNPNNANPGQNVNRPTGSQNVDILGRRSDVGNGRVSQSLPNPTITNNVGKAVMSQSAPVPSISGSRNIENTSTPSIPTPTPNPSQSSSPIPETNSPVTIIPSSPVPETSNTATVTSSSPVIETSNSSGTVGSNELVPGVNDKEKLEGNIEKKPKTIYERIKSRKTKVNEGYLERNKKKQEEALKNQHDFFFKTKRNLIERNYYYNKGAKAAKNLAKEFEYIDFEKRKKFIQRYIHVDRKGNVIVRTKQMSRADFDLYTRKKGLNPKKTNVYGKSNRFFDMFKNKEYSYSKYIYDPNRPKMEAEKKLLEN